MPTVLTNPVLAYVVATGRALASGANCGVIFVSTKMTSHGVLRLYNKPNHWFVIVNSG